MTASVGLRNRRSVGFAARGLDRLNARHPWSHNDHFHGWVLKHLPGRRRAALDVGCGRGRLLAALAPRFDHVTGVDPDPEMVAACASRFAGDPRVGVRRESVLDTEGSFDLVTMVASLHHLSLGPALRRAAALVAPGGRQLVVGLARPETAADIAYDSVSLALNPLVGLLKHPHVARGGRPPEPFPVRDPQETFDEIRAAAAAILPGAVVRRRLFFRYTLRWDRPVG